MLFGLKFRQGRAMYSNTSAPTPPEFQGRARKPALGSGPNIAAYGLEFYVAGFSSAAVLCTWGGGRRGLGPIFDVIAEVVGSSGSQEKARRGGGGKKL